MARNTSTRQIIRSLALFTLTVFILSFGADYVSAYNWPWDQGHDCVETSEGSGNWGRWDYDGVFHGDHTSKECCELICKICPVYVNTGRLQKSFTDLRVPGVGPSLAITRTFQSQEWISTLYGRGWIFDFGRRLIVTRSKGGDKIVGVVQETGERNFFKEHADGTLECLALYGVTYTLTKNPDGTYIIAEKYGRVQHVGANGKLLTISDRNGNTLTFSYDAVGCLSRITNASGNYVDFQLGPNGKIASVSDNIGRTVAYAYDSNGNLISATDPIGNTTQYLYDAENRLTQIVDPRGNTVLAVTYDDNQPPRVLTIMEKGETWTITYFSDHTVKTDSSGNTWTYYFNEVGLIERVIDPLGNVEQQYPNMVTSTSLEWEEDANGNRTTYTYDGDGKVTSKTDPLGNTWQYTYVTGGMRLETETNPQGVISNYEYDADGNRTKVIKDYGGVSQNTTTYAYDAQGNLTSVTDALGNTTQYEYDANGNLARITDPLGNVTMYTYDSRGNRLTDTDALGNITTFTYDLMDRLLTTTDAFGNTTTYAYDANGNRISQTDANGNIVAYDYDAYNRLIQITDPLGNTISYTYDYEDNQTSMTDGNGNSTTYTYDSVSRLIRETNALGEQTNYTYDAAGNMLSVTDACGNTSTFTYDAAGRKTSEMNAAGETITYTYDADGNLIAIALPNGNTITRTYDSLGRLVSVSDSLGTLTTYTYDQAGRLLATTDALGNTASYSYDAAGRQVQATDPMGNSVSHTYDALGRVLSVTDREGNVTSQSYDAVGRMLSQMDQLNNITAFAYDAVGNLVFLTDARGNTTAHTYDAVGRLTRETYADGTNRDFVYDSMGNLISKTDQNAQVTTYAYDVLNRSIQVDYPDTNDSVFTYGCASNMLTANNQHANVSFAYDNIYRLTQSVQSGRTIDIGYDTMARTASVTYPGGRVVKALANQRGTLERIEDGAGQPLIQYTYDGAGRPQTKSYLNGVSASFTSNANGWITQLTYDHGGSQIFGLQYGFDNQGNRTYARKLHDSSISENYLYDAKYRLTQFKRGSLDGSGNIPGPSTQTAYTLDVLDNWNSKTTDGVTQTRTHNNMNELVSIDGTTLTYDDNGNLVDDGTNTYEYDYENRLLKVTRKSDSAVLAEYKYDALGRRLEKSVDGTVTEYVYHTGHVIQEYEDGALGKEYVSGSVPSNGIVFTGSTAHAYHTDSIGNVIGITDGSGNPVETYVYAPYGNTTVFDAGGTEISGSSVGNELMFALMRYDNQSGLYHTLYRKYSADQGRFTTHDPLRSLNRYVYVSSNPINMVDPLGLWEKVPGQANIWMVEDGDTLWKLAVQETRQGNDWVCIWPVEMRNPTDPYQNHLRKCDKFDVSNLTATTGTDLRLAVSPDLQANHNARYGTSSEQAGNVATRIRDTSNQGRTPIALFYLAGHGGRGHFSLSSLTSMTEAIATPSYARAKQKKGPLRCWFTRNAEARFIGCSSQGFARSFANSVLRDGASTFGTNQSIGHTSTRVYWDAVRDSTGNVIRWDSNSTDLFPAAIWEGPFNGGL